MSVFILMGVPGQLKKLTDYMELNGLDANIIEANLDEAISTRADGAHYTPARAGGLDNLSKLDSNVSSTRPYVLKTQRYLSPGNFTWNVPAGIIGDQVFLTGVGGGAGGEQKSTSSAGLGGGAGMGCVMLPMYLPNGTTSVSITVGAGGQGGSYSGDSGDPGQSTYFGNHLRLRGGGEYTPGFPTNPYVGAKFGNAYGNLPPVGYREGFMICGADGGVSPNYDGYDCMDTKYSGGTGNSSLGCGGGASAFANGANYASNGQYGSGGGGSQSGVDAGEGGNGFLEIYWYEQA